MQNLTTNFINQINTLPKSVNDFINYLGTIKGTSKNTMTAYETDLTMFFRFMKVYKGLVSQDVEFNTIEINDINIEFIKTINLNDLYAFISFTEKYKNNGTYARARKVATLKSFFKYLSTKAKVITENPTLELETPKIEKRNPVYLSLNESKKLIEVTKNIDGKFKERDLCIITLFLNCGMRLSELCSINISKIKGDTLTVIGKGSKERTIYLNKSCLKVLNEYMIVRNSIQDKVSNEHKDALFISKNYVRINKRSVERLVKKYVGEAGLDEDKYTPHKLRHSAATLMYKYGNVDIRSLQKILGHSSVSTTQIYTHVDSDDLRKAVNVNPLNDL